MNDKINEIKSTTNIVDVIGRTVRLEKKGPEYIGLCPFHDEKTPSFSVNETKQIFKCFGCGAGGDVFDFFTRQGKTLNEAVEIITSEALFTAPKPKIKATKPIPKVLVPTAEDVLKANFKHYRYGQPSKTWKYHNEDGATIGFACRFDTPTGKDVLPYVFTDQGWRWQGFTVPRPIYNLHLIKQNPAATILVVEGEKTADAAQAQLDPAKTVATTWPGGSKSIQNIDWAPIKDRKKIYFPDNDVQGLSAMLQIKHMIGGAKIVPLNPNFAQNWDCADKEWTKGELREYILARMVDDIEPNATEAINVHGNPVKAWTFSQIGEDTEYTFGIYDKSDKWVFHKITPAPQNPPIDDEGDEQPNITSNDHFKVLGYEKTDSGSLAYSFYANASKTVIRLSPSAMSKSTLMQLAPLQWWEMNFPGAKGMSVESAINMLINRSHDVGVFSDKWIRGRGAWLDNERVVIHAGNSLIVDGKPHALQGIKTKYIYEIGEELGFDTDNPLNTKEANRLMEIINLINFDRDLNAHFLAGWCVIAPICGALRWRPHIWLTGSAGTGKSWIFEKLVRHLLGESALAVQGDATEPGIRQLLRHDALPVVFDEAEGEDRRSQERMQTILALMRGSSTSDGGIIPKGTSGGTAKTYKIRSCFAFASIAVQVAQQSDRTRVTILGLKSLNDPNEKAARWKELQRLYNEIVTDEWCKRLRARTISLMPTILKNAQTFSNAAAAELKAQRTGDQAGAMLAGAYSLYSSKEISYDDAVAWIKSKDWSEERGHELTKDETSLLNHLLDQVVKVEASVGHVDRTIGELVMIASYKEYPGSLDIEGANTRLKRLGMKVDGDFLIISNSASEIKRMLAGTQWAKNHHKILMRLEGASTVESVRFASGTITRGVRIPLTFLERG